MGGNNSNLIMAIVLSVGIIFGWQYFVEKPRLAAMAQDHKNYSSQMQDIKTKSASAPAVENSVLNREDAIANAGRVTISTPHISGSISLKGLRFDDLTLADYKQGIEKDSPSVNLLSPSNTKHAYFASLGWHGDASGTQLPDNNTIWKPDRTTLDVDSKVKFSWKNNDNVEFIVTVAVDHNFMFSIEQATINGSSKPIAFQPYGIINRAYESLESSNNILHEGPIAAINDTLEDVTYEKIKDKKHTSFESSKVNWIGITDKYWLTSFIPDARYKYDSNFTYAIQNGQDRYQVDFVGEKHILDSGKSIEFSTLLFAGAKKVDVLDAYAKQYNISLFDRAIDFGIFYILTKPLFHVMSFFHAYCGNFGISILLVTVLIKLAMFGIANKSYRSMKKMKELQPQIERIKSTYGEDKTKFNQEIMELYKREKVNPVSGCLPLLIQIPVFFSIYKVLYVTIEMRQAPFFGWIHDLSAPDPTTIFNLFGLIAWTPPGFLMLGAWPILMAITMYLQQKMSPEPADPIQATMMKLMPVMFLFMFSRFPAGLLIYWAWNNILSIVQQYYINKMAK